MKNIILLLLFWIIAQTSISQNSYFRILTSPKIDGDGATIETDNGDIIMCTSVATGEYFKNEYLKFIKINTLGDTIASRKFRMPNDYYAFSKIFKLDNNLFVAVGSSFNLLPSISFSVHNKVMYYTFNSDLDSISFKEIVMENDTIQYLSMRDAIINNNNNIVTLCEDMSMRNIMLLEASAMSDSIRSSHLIPTYGVRIYSIMQKSDYTGYFITCEGDYNHHNKGYISHIITIDNNLNFITIDSLPGECAYLSQLRSFNNNIMVGGRARRSWGGYPPPIPPPDPYHTEEYCIEKLDINFNVIKQVFLSHVVLNHHHSETDTISYPAMGQNFSFIDTNSIYSCHFRMYPPAIYPNRQNYFVVAKFNANLEIKWQYYFGYDAFYWLNSIIATTDGGCFVSGMRYDAATQNQEYDIFYLKLDSTGIFVSNHDPLIQVHSVVIYPNPGTDKITLESGPQVLGATFLMYNIQGLKITEQIITANQQTINTEDLQPGAFIWKIVKTGKVLDSGKWIKIKRGF